MAGPASRWAPQRPVTFGPEEMGRLRDIVLGGDFRYARRRRLSLRREFPDALHRRSHRPAEDQAQAEGRRRLRQRHGRRLRAADCSSALGCEVVPARLRARFHLSALQSQSRRPADAARDGRQRCARPAPMSRSASTATATAAASSTTRARRSSPTRSASCWRAISRSCIPSATFVVDVKSTGPVRDRSRC